VAALSAWLVALFAIVLAPDMKMPGRPQALRAQIAVSHFANYRD
jgi:hypothetical protein